MFMIFTYLQAISLRPYLEQKISRFQEMLNWTQCYFQHENYFDSDIESISAILVKIKLLVDIECFF